MLNAAKQWLLQEALSGNFFRNRAAVHARHAKDTERSRFFYGEHSRGELVGLNSWSVKSYWNLVSARKAISLRLEGE
jgi:hypothetical protein